MTGETYRARPLQLEVCAIDGKTVFSLHLGYYPLDLMAGEFNYPSTSLADHMVVFSGWFSLVMPVGFGKSVVLHQPHFLEDLEVAIYRGQADTRILDPGKAV